MGAKKKNPFEAIENQVKPEHIKNPFWREFAERFGTAGVIWLAKQAGGDKAYIPHYKTVIQPAIDELHKAHR